MQHMDLQHKHTSFMRFNFVHTPYLQAFESSSTTFSDAVLWESKMKRKQIADENEIEGRGMEEEKRFKFFGQHMSKC